MAVGAGRAASASPIPEANGEGDFGRDCEPLALPADRKGEAVRETPGGVPVREGGLLGRLMVGLSQEEKKSSAGSPAGVDEPSAPGVESRSSVMTTSSGYLFHRKRCAQRTERRYQILLRISFRSALEFLFVLIGGIGSVFDFCVFACKGSAATVHLEEFSGGLVAPNF